MKIVAFGASSSKQSINKQFATYVAHLVPDSEVDVLDLNDFEMPIYSIDKEQEIGIPQLAKDFKDRLRPADGIIISFAEHNGSYAAAFKNIYDWISRVEKEIWLNKPMLLLATSPGARGAANALENAVREFPHRRAEVIASFSLPSFGQNFENGELTNDELKAALQSELDKFVAAIS